MYLFHPACGDLCTAPSLGYFTILANNSSLLADASSSIFTGSTVPKWLSQAANRGRNVVVLRDSARTDDQGEGENGDGIAIPPGTDRN